MKGSAVKTISVGVLLFLLSIVSYSQISDALSGAGEPLSETRASSSIAVRPPSLNTPVGAIALDASSGRPPPGPTRNDNHLAANLSTYVFLHKTRNESISAPTTTRVSVCSE
jgi:hypothetical protein